MDLYLENAELVLRENLPVKLADARGTIIRCLSGIAWLTVEGETRDLFLTAGESHRLAGNGLALIEAIGTASIDIREPEGRT